MLLPRPGATLELPTPSDAMVCWDRATARDGREQGKEQKSTEDISKDKVAPTIRIYRPVVWSPSHVPGRWKQPHIGTGGDYDTTTTIEI